MVVSPIALLRRVACQLTRSLSVYVGLPLESEVKKSVKCVTPATITDVKPEMVDTAFTKGQRLVLVVVPLPRAAVPHVRSAACTVIVVSVFG